MDNTNSNPDEEKKIAEAGAVFEEYFSAQEKGDMEEQKAISEKIWQFVADHQADEPSPWLQCMDEANRCASVFDWAGMKAAYLRSLEAVADKPGFQSNTYNCLRAFHLMFDRKLPALQAARAASEAARQTRLFPLLVPQLQSEAHMVFDSGDFQRAWNIVSETFDLIEAGHRYGLLRAKSMVLRAEYFIATGDLLKAEADLTATWEILQPQSEAHFAAGWQFALASWWATMATLRTKQGDSQALATAWRESVARRRIVAAASQLEGPYKYNALAIALHHWGKAIQAGYDGLAATAFAESDSIRQSIGLPPLGRQKSGETH